LKVILGNLRSIHLSYSPNFSTFYIENEPLESGLVLDPFPPSQRLI
jgi:hypothetical protein